MATTTVFLPSGTPDLVVEAFSTPDPSYLLDVASPDDFGRVTFDLPEALLSSLFGEDRPEVFFRVWSSSTLLADTEKTARWHTRNRDTTFRLELKSLRLPGKPSPHVVRGRVHASDHKQGWSVEALDKTYAGSSGGWPVVRSMSMALTSSPTPVPICALWAGCSLTSCWLYEMPMARNASAPRSCIAPRQR